MWKRDVRRYSEIQARSQQRSRKWVTQVTLQPECQSHLENEGIAHTGDVSECLQSFPEARPVPEARPMVVSRTYTL
jgi:hypothetical protein